MPLEEASRRVGPRRRRAPVLLLLASVLCGGAARAGAPRVQPQQADVPLYAADVGAVALDVVVTDRKGRLVKDLAREDFRVLEVGVPQELSFFEADRTPVTVLVLLDSSASVRSHMLSVQKAANRFIDKLARGDRARVGFFHERVVLGPRFTDDMKEHSAIIKRMRPQRSTHLFDALVEGLDALEPVQGRKVLLVFSDGADEGSRATMPVVLEAARRSDASVYAVGLVGWSAAAGMHTDQAVLEEVSRVTGGRAFFPEDEDAMKDAFDRIRSELRNQYRMGYVPDERAAGSGGWREVSVELTRRRGLTVRCRLGYQRTPGETP